VKTFDSALSLLDSAHVRDIAFLIADVRMPEMSGIELHGELLAGGCSASQLSRPTQPAGMPVS